MSQPRCTCDKCNRASRELFIVKTAVFIGSLIAWMMVVKLANIVLTILK